MGAIDYSGRAAEFRRRRTPPPAVLDVLGRTIVEWGLGAGPPVLDLGAGPGAFVAPLHRWFGGPVVAVEPSPAMRAEAVAGGAAAEAWYLDATAERLPLRDGSIGVAWLSTVVHQLDDVAAAAAELRRVVRPGGAVLVRNLFADVGVTGLLSHLPGVAAAAAQAFPSSDEVVATFGAVGLELVGATDVAEPWAAEVEAWAEWVRSMGEADSLLRHLTSEQRDEGVARAQSSDDGGGPVDNPLTLRLLALRRM